MKAMREMADEGMLTRTVDGIEGKQGDHRGVTGIEDRIEADRLCRGTRCSAQPLKASKS
jgi:hypothetical protein